MEGQQIPFVPLDNQKTQKPLEIIIGNDDNSDKEKPKSDNSESFNLQKETEKISKIIKERLQIIVKFMQGTYKTDVCPQCHSQIKKENEKGSINTMGQQPTDRNNNEYRELNLGRGSILKIPYGANRASSKLERCNTYNRKLTGVSVRTNKESVKNNNASYIESPIQLKKFKEYKGRKESGGSTLQPQKVKQSPMILPRKSMNVNTSNNKFGDYWKSLNPNEKCNPKIRKSITGEEVNSRLNTNSRLHMVRKSITGGELNSRISQMRKTEQDQDENQSTRKQIQGLEKSQVSSSCSEKSKSRVDDKSRFRLQALRCRGRVKSTNFNEMVSKCLPDSSEVSICQDRNYLQTGSKDHEGITRRLTKSFDNNFDYADDSKQKIGDQNVCINKIDSTKSSIINKQSIIEKDHLQKNMSDFDSNKIKKNVLGISIPQTINSNHINQSKLQGRKKSFNQNEVKFGKSYEYISEALVDEYNDNGEKTDKIDKSVHCEIEESYNSDAKKANPDIKTQGNIYGRGMSKPNHHDNLRILTLNNQASKNNAHNDLSVANYKRISMEDNMTNNTFIPGSNLQSIAPPSISTTLFNNISSIPIQENISESRNLKKIEEDSMEGLLSPTKSKGITFSKYNSGQFDHFESDINLKEFLVGKYREESYKEEESSSQSDLDNSHVKPQINRSQARKSSTMNLKLLKIPMNEGKDVGSVIIGSNTQVNNQDNKDNFTRNKTYNDSKFKSLQTFEEDPVKNNQEERSPLMKKNTITNQNNFGKNRQSESDHKKSCADRISMNNLKSLHVIKEEMVVTSQLKTKRSKKSPLNRFEKKEKDE